MSQPASQLNLLLLGCGLPALPHNSRAREEGFVDLPPYLIQQAVLVSLLTRWFITGGFPTAFVQALQKGSHARWEGEVGAEQAFKCFASQGESLHHLDRV